MKKLLILLIFPFLVSAQIGIGTENPDASAILEIKSTESGVLLPRMTTSERNSIATPADGLTVYDTTANSYFYYDGDLAEWLSLSSSKNIRDNYVIVKSESDFPEPTGGVITLNEDTYYEINGLITLTNTIDLNGAYLAGKDVGEDILSRTSGTIIQSSAGGLIKNISLNGGQTFNITGGSLLTIQNSIISNATTVGSISNVGVAFLNILQYTNNSDGVTFSDINTLLLNNQAWLSSNSGVYETYSGTFDLIQKVSGFFDVSTGNTAIDVSSNPNVTNGVILNTVFKGTATDYINEYTTGAGINFNKSWYINSPGIKNEYDDIATGNIYYDGSLSTGFGQEIDGVSGVKLSGDTSSSSLLRFDTNSQSNRLRYIGKTTRNFSFKASLSVRVAETIADFYAFYIVKNGTTQILNSKSIFYNDNNLVVKSISLSGNLELKENDYIEIYVERLTNNIGLLSSLSSLVVFSMNLTID